VNNLIFSDRLLIFVSTLALIITMGFVAMMFQDLNDLWSEILKFQERINNLEILTLKNMGKIGCSI
jgi:hypothetical protein